MQLDKRGQMGSLTVLGGLVITLVVVGLVSVIGLQLMDDTKDDLDANSYALNGTQDAEAAIAKIPSKLPLIVTAVIGAVLIGIVVSFLAFGRR